MKTKIKFKELSNWLKTWLIGLTAVTVYQIWQIANILDITDSIIELQQMMIDVIELLINPI